MARYTLSVYSDKKGQYRWRLTAPNGKITSDSGEGYATRGNAIRATRKLAVMALVAKVV